MIYLITMGFNLSIVFLRVFELNPVCTNCLAKQEENRLEHTSRKPGGGHKMNTSAGEKRSQILTELSASAAWETLSDLNRIGPRWLGTRGELSARAYLLKRMGEVGLQDVHLEHFAYLNYMPISSELRIISPLLETLQCEPLEYTANTSAEGQLVYVGAGSEAEFQALEKQGIDFRDKIVASLTSRSFSLIWPLSTMRVSSRSRTFARWITRRS